MALTERLQIIIDALGVGAISEFKKVGSSVTSELSRVDRATKGTRQEAGLLNGALNKLGLQSVDSGTALKVGLAASATAAGVAAVKLGGNYLDATRAVDDFSDATGASAKDSSKIINALRAVGSDTDRATLGMLRFTRALGESPEKFAAFGVEVAKNKDGTTNVAASLGNLADAFNALKDPTDRARLGALAFGQRGLAPMLDLLQRGKAGIDALGNSGPVFSDAQINKSIQFQIALKETHNTLSKVGSFLGGVVVQSVSGYALALDRLTGGHGAAAAAAQVQAGAESKLQGVLDQAQSSVIGAVQSLNSAQRARQAADRAVGNAVNAQRDAQENLNDLLKKGAIDAKAVASAQDSLAQSDRGVAQATKTVAEAEAHLAKVRQGASALELGKAGLGVGEAQLGVRDAALAVKQARASLVSARSSGDPLGMAQAQQQLAHALLSQQAAAFSLVDAQQNLNDTQNKGKEGSDDLKQAQDQLASAQDALANAEQSRKSSLEALHTAEVGDVNFSKEVRAAREAVASATSGVADAQYNAKVAAENFGLAQQAANEALSAGTALGSQLVDQLNAMYAAYPGVKPLLDQLSGLLDPNAGRAGISTANTSTGPNANFMGPVAGRTVGDTVSSLAPGLNLVWNKTGKRETYMNADYAAGRGGTTYVTINTGADPNEVVRVIREYERKNGSGWRNN